MAKIQSLVYFGEIVDFIFLSMEKDAYCSTSQAASLLGVSLGTVQQMVEDGVLQAWKTTGGHRRILRDSIAALLARRGGAHPRADGATEVSLLIAEDDPILQRLYRHTVSNWGLPIRVEIVDNGIDGLVSVGRSVPDVLIVDLLLPGVDGFEMVRTLRADPSLECMDIIVVSGLEDAEIDRRGGLPPDITRYPKPVPFHELRGYFQAKVAQRRKATRQPAPDISA